MSGRIHSLGVPGVVLIEAAGSADTRGVFRDFFDHDLVRKGTGRNLMVRQVNSSVSVRGALRGISVTDVPPPQTKIVTCVHGAILDVTVDLRRGSPEFGRWHMERLGHDRPAAVVIPPGVGHAFLALENGSAVVYLLSSEHASEKERRVNPLDPEIGIMWPDGFDLVLSPRDAAASALTGALEEGLLPSYAACTASATAPETALTSEK